jgi:hypothetical protein
MESIRTSNAPTPGTLPRRFVFTPLTPQVRWPRATYHDPRPSVRLEPGSRPSERARRMCSCASSKSTGDPCAFDRATPPLRPDHTVMASESSLGRCAPSPGSGQGRSAHCPPIAESNRSRAPLRRPSCRTNGCGEAR